LFGLDVLVDGGRDVDAGNRYSATTFGAPTGPRQQCSGVALDGPEHGDHPSGHRLGTDLSEQGWLGGFQTSDKGANLLIEVLSQRQAELRQGWVSRSQGQAEHVANPARLYLVPVSKADRETFMQRGLAEPAGEQVVDVLGDVAAAAVAYPDEGGELADPLAWLGVCAYERAEQL
jgi:hypothetical protein